MGTAWHENHTASLAFSRVGGSAPDSARAALLYGHNIPISGRTASRESVPYKEKRTLPGTPADVCELVCVAALASERRSPCPGSGILTRFPFAIRRAVFVLISSISTGASTTGHNLLRGLPDLLFYFFGPSIAATAARTTWRYSNSATATSPDSCTLS